MNKVVQLAPVRADNVVPAGKHVVGLGAASAALREVRIVVFNAPLCKMCICIFTRAYVYAVAAQGRLFGSFLRVQAVVLRGARWVKPRHIENASPQNGVGHNFA